MAHCDGVILGKKVYVKYYKTQSEAGIVFEAWVHSSEHRNGEAYEITLGRVDRFGTIRRWQRSEQNTATGLSVSEQVNIKYGYKIHGFKTTCDPILSSNTLKWYETEDEAIKAATKMIKRSNNEDALVIYKAIKIVRRDDPPVEIEDLD